MVYNSLTEVPRNLKEGIDWLVALRGTDAEKNLAAMGAALYKFLAEKPVGFTEVPALEKVKLISKEFLEKPALRNMWPARAMLRRFNDPMYKEQGLIAKWFGDLQKSDYENVIQTRGVKPETIAKNLVKAVAGCEQFLENVKIPDQYESAYNSEATWEASCAKDPEACAVVLVGVAPMLYAGLRSLKVASEGETRGGVPMALGMSSLGSVLIAVGYEETQWRAAMTASYVFKALKGVSHQVLTTLYDLSGFWAFYGLDKADVESVEAASNSSAKGGK
ncbi:hypothetical protein, conserved [Babesia ovata]|uniref:Uncharacterized protein n=1 Tax=Babesia ovata TaxID=189622 RepID=A0A2H6K9V7_9APIC|nr:uncharacterized protein BOVATA_012630 [Babesia ovata]GBE59770.1 hypothetical protein, conserved [Babesia ovata]